MSSNLKHVLSLSQWVNHESWNTKTENIEILNAGDLKEEATKTTTTTTKNFYD